MVKGGRGGCLQRSCWSLGSEIEELKIWRFWRLTRLNSRLDGLGNDDLSPTFLVRFETGR